MVKRHLAGVEIDIVWSSTPVAPRILGHPQMRPEEYCPSASWLRFTPDYGAVGFQCDQSGHVLVLIGHPLRCRGSNSLRADRVGGGGYRGIRISWEDMREGGAGGGREEWRLCPEG